MITLNDEDNQALALRADSTLDVVRLITKRLGRTTTHKKWFYIQPVFTYPSSEKYQIGVEWIEHNKMSDLINLNVDLLNSLNKTFEVQIANIKIPKLISKELNIDINLFKNSEIGKIFDLNISWLSNLVRVKTINDLENIISEVPTSIKDELVSLVTIAKEVKTKDIIVSPLYYSVMKYYEGICYKIIYNNLTLSCGGSYKSNDINSLGFALYTDNLLEDCC